MPSCRGKGKRQFSSNEYYIKIYLHNSYLNHEIINWTRANNVARKSFEEPRVCYDIPISLSVGFSANSQVISQIHAKVI